MAMRMRKPKFYLLRVIAACFDIIDALSRERSWWRWIRGPILILCIVCFMMSLQKGIITPGATGQNWAIAGTILFVIYLWVSGPIFKNDNKKIESAREVLRRLMEER